MTRTRWLAGRSCLRSKSAWYSGSRAGTPFTCAAGELKSMAQSPSKSMPLPGHAGGTGAGSHGAAPRGRATSVSGELPPGLLGHPDGWASRGAARGRRGIDGRVQRPRGGHPARDAYGRGVRDERRARTGWILWRRSRLPRSAGDPQPPVRGGDAAGDRPRGRAPPQGSQRAGGHAALGSPGSAGQGHGAAARARDHRRQRCDGGGGHAIRGPAGAGGSG